MQVYSVVRPLRDQQTGATSGLLAVLTRAPSSLRGGPGSGQLGINSADNHTCKSNRTTRHGQQPMKGMVSNRTTHSHAAGTPPGRRDQEFVALFYIVISKIRRPYQLLSVSRISSPGLSVSSLSCSRRKIRIRSLNGTFS